jgi:hypothetical protein
LPIVRIVASMSAFRRSGSIPTFGIRFLLIAKYFLLIDRSIKIAPPVCPMTTP